MSLSQNGFHSSLNALNLNSSIAASNGNNFLNSSWNSNVNGNGTAPTNGNGWVGKCHKECNLYRSTRLGILKLFFKEGHVCMYVYFIHGSYT